MVCLVLLIFLGGWGGHRFYAGKTASAFGMLILTVLNLFLYFSSLFLNSGLFLNLDYLIDYIDLSDINLSNLTILGIMVIISAILGLWWIIDLILIVIGKFKDSKGRYIKIRN